VEFSYNALVQWLDKTVQALVGHRKQLVLGVITLLAAALLIVGYQWYDQRAQVKAHQAFLDAQRIYEAQVSPGHPTIITPTSAQFGSEEEKWKKVEEVFKETYSKHKGTGIAPVFLTYQADAQAHLGKTDDAIVTLEIAVKAMSSLEIKDFYRLKLALMKMDSNKEAVKQEGFAELKKIAEASTNYANEAGLFYIGNYFWTQKDYSQAKNYWQQLMVKYGLKEQQKDQSGFAELARSKLKLISADW